MVASGLAGVCGPRGGRTLPRWCVMGVAVWIRPSRWGRRLLAAVALASAVVALRQGMGADGPWVDWAGGPLGVGGVGRRLPVGAVTVVAWPPAAGRMAEVLRDGMVVGFFRGGPLTVLVLPGDYLGARAGDMPVGLRVLAVSPNVRWPKTGALLIPGRAGLVPQPVEVTPPAARFRR